MKRKQYVWISLLVMVLGALALGLIPATATLAAESPTHHAISAVAPAAPTGKEFGVNSNVDAPDFAPGDEKCETAQGNGICTLRAAIMETNALAGEDYIHLFCGTSVLLTRVGEDDTALNGDLDITDDVRLWGINADCVNIDGNGSITNDRVFHILSGTVTILKVTIQNGYALQKGGGILNHGTLTLNQSTVLQNKGFAGGGIFNDGTAVLTYSTVRENNSGVGGGVVNFGTLLVSHSTLSGNTAQTNDPNGRGGGLLNHIGISVLTNTTVSGNYANADAGGIYVQSGTVNLRNVTIAFNSANADLTGAANGGGVLVNTGAIFNVRNSILAENIISGPIFDTYNDCAGTVSSEDYNLFRVTTACSVQGFTVNNKTGVSQLDALADNGGETFTHALKSSSPAIDAGNPSGCVDDVGATLTMDQRRFVRPWNGQCDIGAYEYNSPGVPTVTPFPTPTHTPSPTSTPTATPAACNAKPTAPTLSQPANNTEITTKKPTLDWNDAPCAEKYKVVVKQDAKDGAKVFKKKVTVSQTQTTALAKGHTYYWRVKAINSFGSTKSAWFMFSINP